MQGRAELSQGDRFRSQQQVHPVQEDPASFSDESARATVCGPGVALPEGISPGAARRHLWSLAASRRRPQGADDHGTGSRPRPEFVRASYRQNLEANTGIYREKRLYSEAATDSAQSSYRFCAETLPILRKAATVSAQRRYRFCAGTGGE